MSRYAKIAYTDSVRSVQEENGSVRAAARALAHGETPDPLTDAEAAFIGSRDGFYVASVGETGWPYVQFRGGPPGFVQVLDERTLGWAEVRGNRQYITTGNVRADDRMALFFIDHPQQMRVKLFGHATTQSLDQDPELTARLTAVRTDGHLQRLMIVRVEGYAWNCHQHITPRYSEAELSPVLGAFHDRIAVLEQENQALRARINDPH